MNPCVEYQGFIASNGYGRRWSALHKKMSSAHRVAWEEANGPIPEGRCVLHTCDNRRCINLDHLYLGSMSDNSQDMVRRKRRRWDGEHGPRHKLTTEQVETIRCDARSYRTIGAEYGVHHSTIYAIKKGRSWSAAST